MVELFANSGDPDQMPHSAGSDLGLHWLPVTRLGVSSLQWVKAICCSSLVKLIAVPDDVLSILFSMSFHWVIVYIIHTNLFFPFNTLPALKACKLLLFFFLYQNIPCGYSLELPLKICRLIWEFTFHIYLDMFCLAWCWCEKRILMLTASCKAMVLWCSLIRTSNICQYTILYSEAHNFTKGLSAP